MWHIPLWFISTIKCMNGIQSWSLTTYTVRESMSMAFNAASFLLTWNLVCWLTLAGHDRVWLLMDRAPGLLQVHSHAGQPGLPRRPVKNADCSRTTVGTVLTAIHVNLCTQLYQKPHLHRAMWVSAPHYIVRLGHSYRRPATHIWILSFMENDMVLTS